jgi:site-specific DNA-cytosine methylase
MPEKTFKAIGITCGIGSMLLGAKQAGFEILGNVEWRNYYRRVDANGDNTFLRNFSGSKLFANFQEMEDNDVRSFSGADVAFGHP